MDNRPNPFEHTIQALLDAAPYFIGAWLILGLIALAFLSRSKYANREALFVEAFLMGFTALFAYAAVVNESIVLGIIGAVLATYGVRRAVGHA